MSDRFVDLAKAIFDHKDFPDLEEFLKELNLDRRTVDNHHVNVNSSLTSQVDLDNNNGNFFKGKRGKKETSSQIKRDGRDSGVLNKDDEPSARGETTVDSKSFKTDEMVTRYSGPTDELLTSPDINYRRITPPDVAIPLTTELKLNDNKSPNVTVRSGGGGNTGAKPKPPNSIAFQGPTHVDGPLDGSPYAVINPWVKQNINPDSADGDSSVGLMKDLDRLINALVQEAESIDLTYSSIPDSSRSNNLYNSSSKGLFTSSDSGRTLSQTHRTESTNRSTREYRRPDFYEQSTIPNIDQLDSSRNKPNFDEDLSGHQLFQQPSEPNSSEGGAGRIPRSISHQPNSSSSSFTQYNNSRQNQRNIEQNQSYERSGPRRMRSQSADGQRDSDRNENPDEWLARQMMKLQQKRASTTTRRNDWLDELKRALPAERQSRPRNDENVEEAIRQQLHRQQLQQQLQQRNQFQQQSMSRRTYASVPETEVQAQPPRGGSALAFSSDDDEDDVEVDLEVFRKGQKLKRYHSANAYDSSQYASVASTRAPSQLSYNEAPFPTCPPTPYSNRPVSPGKPPRSPKISHRYQGAASAPIGTVNIGPINNHVERAQTPVNPRPIFMVESEVKFAQDLSEYWYKPYASREEAVAALMQASLGYFIIRNSSSFPGAYGLAIKVSDTGGEKGIRHFLIEPTRFGVRLRGCGSLEPVFSSLSAFVYAHSIESLALPMQLTLPSCDILPSSRSQSTTAQLLKQGAACQLLFLGMVGVECLTGDEAIHKGIMEVAATSPVPISLRLSKSGLTMTDVFRKQFFRIHFGLNEISYASVVNGRSVAYGREVKQVFGVVARAPRARENSVIILAELEQGQPASAIVSFIQRVLAWQQL